MKRYSFGFGGDMDCTVLIFSLKSRLQKSEAKPRICGMLQHVFLLFAFAVTLESTVDGNAFGALPGLFREHR